MQPYQERTYRNLVKNDDLISYQVVVKESDLSVHTKRPLFEITKELIIKYRTHIEAFIRQFPIFEKTLVPFHIDFPAPEIVREMTSVATTVNVGPMAAVAGAIAEYVGRGLLNHTRQVVIENGGDVFLKTNSPVIIGIYAGKSPLSLRIGLKIDSSEKPISVCTSSGTVGHSLSLGKADAVTVISESCLLADAAATSVGNRLNSKKDIQKVLEFGKSINGVLGLVIIKEDKIGAWGNIELVSVKGKKG